MSRLCIITALLLTLPAFADSWSIPHLDGTLTLPEGFTTTDAPSPDTRLALALADGPDDPFREALHLQVIPLSGSDAEATLDALVALELRVAARFLPGYALLELSPRRGGLLALYQHAPVASAPTLQSATLFLRLSDDRGTPHLVILTATAAAGDADAHRGDFDALFDALAP